MSRMRPTSHTAGARPAQLQEADDHNPPEAFGRPIWEALQCDAKRDLSLQNDTGRDSDINHWRVAFHDVFHGTEEQRTNAKNTMLCTEQRAAALRFASRRSPREIHASYAALSATQRRKQLPNILVGCLLTGAELTLRVLEGLPSLLEDFDVRMDCLLKLRRDSQLWSEIERSQSGQSGQSLKRAFYNQLEQLREHVELPRFALRSGHAALILEEATALEQGTRFLQKYLATYAVPDRSVVLLFVDFFIRWEDSEQALGALRLIMQNSYNASDKRLLQRCTNLLKLDTIDTQGESKNFKLLPLVLELGIKPDRYIHNMIIMNAIKAKVPRVGWDLFEYLQAEGHKTDAVTHLLLLKDAFARQDVSSLNKILLAISERNDLYQNPDLVGTTMNIIRIIYGHERRANPSTIFSHILSIHNRAWLPNIYISLKMIQANDVSRPSNLALRDPPPEALAWTILQFCLTQTQIALVDRLWANLTRAIRTENVQMLSAATCENLYAGFIVFYGRNPQTLGKAVDIVQYMLDSPHCQPTGLTWIRLMCGYLRQGQHQEAEQIRRVMRRRGIEPTGKEFAYLLEKWPNTEVAARARLAIAGQDDLAEQDLSRPLDEELFEGVLLPDEADENSSLDDGTAKWDGMLDLRKQDTSMTGAEEMGTRASRRASIVDLQARKGQQ